VKDRKTFWEDNLKKVREQYPTLRDASWMQVLREDQDVFSDMLGDVLKTRGKRSKPGKRPVLDRNVAVEEFEKISGQSFSDLPFHRAFQALTFGRSIRNIASKTGLQKDHVHRLLKGTVSPSFDAMEKVAAAFSKDPSYFVEYRVNYVLLMIGNYLTQNPETASVWYKRMGGGKWD
jgi:hypothetical protein